MTAKIAMSSTILMTVKKKEKSQIITSCLSFIFIRAASVHNDGFARHAYLRAKGRLLLGPLPLRSAQSRRPLDVSVPLRVRRL